MCNVCVIHDSSGKPVAYRAYLMNFGGQHRGQDSTGIATSDGKELYNETGAGEVRDVFSDKHSLSGLPGHIALGHNRYPTSGSCDDKNNHQPCITKNDGNHKREVSVALNGNIVNAGSLRTELEDKGCNFLGRTDTEVIAHRLATAEGSSLDEIMRNALEPLRGAYSLGILINDFDGAIAVRDPWGFRPLVLGKNNGAYVACSETCSLDSIEASYDGEVSPGEMVVLDGKGFSKVQLFQPKRLSQCIFEHVYFARPDSIIFGTPGAIFRLESGRVLAQRHPVEADYVCPIPDSSIYAAIGFSMESGIPFLPDVVRSHYVGRTFIEPSQERRIDKLMLKFGIIQALIMGKNIAFVDDSIIRANTLMNLINRVVGAGAHAAHVRIASPPTIGPCYWGMDFPDPKELGYNKYSGVEGIRRHIGATTLGYLTPEELLGTARWVSKTYRDGRPYDSSLKIELDDITDVSGAEDGYCTGCFTAKHPLDTTGALLSKEDA